MALIVDAGALYAQADADEPGHAAVRAILENERETLVTTELAVAEADYLILDRLGPDVELAFLADLAEGTYVVECLDRRQLQAARDVVAQYRDLLIGLADASIVVIAERYATRRILSFDERDFRTIRPLQGGAFTILPADSPRSRRASFLDEVREAEAEYSEGKAKTVENQEQLLDDLQA